MIRMNLDGLLDNAIEQYERQKTRANDLTIRRTDRLIAQGEQAAWGQAIADIDAHKRCFEARPDCTVAVPIRHVTAIIAERKAVPA